MTDILTKLQLTIAVQGQDGLKTVKAANQDIATSAKEAKVELDQMAGAQSRSTTVVAAAKPVASETALAFQRMALGLGAIGENSALMQRLTTPALNTVATTAKAAATGLQAATVASTEAAAATGRLTTASAGAAGSMGLARVAGSGLSALVGGPLGAAMLAGTAIMSGFGLATDAVRQANEKVKASLGTSVEILDNLRAQAKDTAEETVLLSIAMGDSATNADTAAAAYDRQSAAAAGAARSIRDMTLAQRVQELDKVDKQLADLKSAQRTTGLLGLVTTDNTERGANARSRLLNSVYGNETKRRFSGKSDAQLFAEASANRDNLSASDRKLLDQSNARTGTFQASGAAIRAAEVQREALAASINGPQAETPTLVDEIVVRGKANKKSSGAKLGFNAGVSAKDAAADVAAETAHTAALIAGGQALDDWRVAEAGRQAVEKVGLADKPKLTAAEQTLIGTIRNRAEETERLKIANERVDKAVGLTRAAEADTKALLARAEAAGKGEQALEDLQVQEAGAQALNKLGVESLDQLSGKTREWADKAIAAAQAQERQSIATAKASRTGEAIRDLDRRIAQQQAYAGSLTGGLEAQVAYAQAEAVRQEIERVGTNLTADQVAAITAKTKALFAAGAAADQADLTYKMGEELRLSRLTNQERDLEERFLQRKGLLLAQGLDLTKEELDARARAAALAEQGALADGRAIGTLRESLERTFIESGKLGFDQVGDYAQQRLREAVYKALLAEPFDIIINAVVGGLSGLGGGSAASSATGLSGLLNASGSLSGLTGSATTALTGLLNKTSLSTWNAAKLGGYGGAAIGGAGTGLMVSGLASALGLSQNKGNQVGGAIGGAIGSFIPIPGGTLIGSALGNLVGGLLGGKKSNEAAVLDLDATGAVTNIGGAKRNADTTSAAQSIATAVAQVQAALTAAGATLGATVSKIDIGQRDSTHLNFSNGTSMDTAVGDASAAIVAATQTIIANAKWATEAQTTYAQKMLAAGATLDQVTAALSASQSLSTSIEDAILQLQDPIKYQRDQALKTIDESYKAVKSQAEELIAAGLVSGDVLARLDALKDLQVADSIAKLGDAASDAAEALKAAQEQADAAAAVLAADKTSAAELQGSVEDQILAILDPVAAKTKTALDGIEDSYQANLAEAQRLVQAGLLSSQVFDQLAVLKDLQIDQVMTDLAGSATDAADAFEATKPKIRSWLEGLASSSAAELNPASARAVALKQYQDNLAAARGGDATAAANYSTYADRLLAADRAATSSAKARLALSSQLTSDATGLLGTSVPVNDNAAVVGSLSQVQALLATIQSNTNPAVSPLADFGQLYVEQIVPQTDKIVAAVDKMRIDIMAAISNAGGATSTALGEVQTAFEEGLNALSAQFAQVADDQAQLRQDAALQAVAMRMVANR